VCYLDNILINSANEEVGLYCNAEKCQLGVRELGFLGFVINSDVIGMESDRISMIEAWPTLESVRDVQVLFGFTKFYRRFIQKYAKVTAPISNLLKTQRSRKWEWTRDAELAFRRLKMAFTEAPIVQHFKPQ
jgi:hypothetical protein